MIRCQIKPLSLLLLLLVLMAGCRSEAIKSQAHASETFYVQNAGAAMRVLVEGNTGSNTFLLIVHGGPGLGSFSYNTDYISRHLEDKYAVVYWDQRNAGASQGNANQIQLTLSQMTDDLKKVIQVLKHRYGQGSRVFILGHSFGGLLATSFMTQGDNQHLVEGWIYANGTHNYPLNDSLTRLKLLSVGREQIALGVHVDEWRKIVAYCQAHPGHFPAAKSARLAAYAAEAETYFEQVKQTSALGSLVRSATRQHAPVSSVVVNLLRAGNGELNRQLAATSLSELLPRITKPTLVLGGAYDFICPQNLGEEVFDQVRATEKRQVVSPVSGHLIMQQDEELFCREVSRFVEQYQ